MDRALFTVAVTLPIVGLLLLLVLTGRAIARRRRLDREALTYAWRKAHDAETDGDRG